ncbi:MAG: hypothetical protein HY392_00975 [Candidatus Diapherotrites archaeon]|nr:hypothetical protein [Candidatus Diapherotrites archaeon]
MEKIYQKIGKLEMEIVELKYAVLPVEKIPRKELSELRKASRQMQKGEFLTAKEAITILEK